MVFKEPINLYKMFKDLIGKSLSEERPNIEVFQVTDMNKDVSGQIVKYSANIKKLNDNLQYTNVAIGGIGLGNLNGVYKPLNAGDLVICGWLDKYTPIILTSVSDLFTQTPDNIPIIGQNEMIIVGKERGSYIYFDSTGQIIIRGVDSEGNVSNGARFKMSPDGAFKLFDKGNYGLQSDGSGNVTIFGDLTINGSVSSLKDGNNDAVVSTLSKQAGNF